MKPTLFSSSIFSFGSLGRKAAGLLLCLAFLGRAGLAQTYVNNQNVYYNIPNGPTPPQIVDPGFDNQSIFSITYETFVNNQILPVEPWVGTLFYTNNAEMMVNAPFTGTNYLDIDGPGVEYVFDLQEGNSHVLADTFYNPGTIHCDSILDGNNVEVFDGFTYFFQTSIGGFLAQATNIIDPGNIVVGAGGQLTLNGQNVNLTRSVLTEETGENEAGIVGNAPFTGSGIFGSNTNYWDPSVELQPTTAESAFFPTPPYYLNLTNSTPYFQPTFPVTGSNTVIIRSAFVQDTSPTNVTYTVYFNTGSLGLGGGDVTIQWEGVYLNPATGLTLTNYLYLNDDYILSGATNIALQDGYPDCFTITASSVPLITQTPATAGFDPVFLSGSITNRYAFGNFSSVNVAETNVSGLNPEGSLTNLPNRIVINATRELNLNLAQMSGQIYTSLKATNQFDGSAGASIASPYSDLNLGVTNGTLTISNLLEAQFPEWNGTIQAWSTRWLEVNTNTTPATTNDYRVLLVDSQLYPLTAPQIDNLTMSATNLVIADQLNVFGTPYSDAQTMTVTTNIVGTGATSVEGALNLENPNDAAWVWAGAFPSLQCITNNGIIVAPNFNYFTSSVPVINMVTSIPPVAATATLSETILTNNVTTSNTVAIGQPGLIFTYTFTNGAINSTTPAYLVKIGSTFDASMNNLIAAINFTNGMGTLYGTNKGYANEWVTAGPLASHSFTVTAAAAYVGTIGNSFTVSTSATNLTWNSTTLAGGAGAVPGYTNVTSSPVPYSAIVNNGLLSDEGSTMWVNNFVNGGIFTNGVGSLTLNSISALFTNGPVSAGGDVSLTAGTLEISNVVLQVGRSLTLQVTNTFSDEGVTTNGDPWTNNVWTVDSTNGTGFDALGLILPFLPTNMLPGTAPGTNNLLGTSITMESPQPNKQVASYWAGVDYGASAGGYNTNNMAIGQLVLNSLNYDSAFYFSGPAGAPLTNSYAIYVNQLVLENYASYANGQGTFNIPTFFFNTNVVIYYADAVASSTVSGGPMEDVSSELDGSNTNHFQWVPGYAGYATSIDITYPGGTVYAINSALASDPYVDSIGNGNDNDDNAYPVFEPSQWNFKFALTNLPPRMGLLTWDSIPSATNTIYYTTNLMSPNWMLVTQFVSPGQILTPTTWPLTNTLVEPLHMTTPHGFYRVLVNPNTTVEYP